MQEHDKFDVQFRFAVAGLLQVILFVFGLDQLTRYRDYSHEIWKHFWISAAAAVAVAVVWPLLRRGAVWLRVLAALFCLFPFLLFCYVIAAHFDILPKWMK